MRAAVYTRYGPPDVVQNPGRIFTEGLPKPFWVNLSISRHLFSLASALLFELHRADIVQGRVQSCLVIPSQPVESFIFRLAKSFEAPAVQPFHLQRGKQRLARSVVPAATLATHRSCDSMLSEYRAELVAGCLRDYFADSECMVGRMF